MYRGDDIYLLDYWPLDNLNTLGGGLRLSIGHTTLALHAGVNRLEDEFQLQTIEVPNPRFGADEVVVLDRQRTIVSVKTAHELHRLRGPLSLKVAVYGELHHLPEGTLRREPDYREELPDDLGWVAGAQLGLWGFGDSSFVNLWVRGAGGLAAYGEMAIPFGLDGDKRAAAARDLVIALSTNYERHWLGVMTGGYLRYFRDADGNLDDPDDGWEYVFAVRPHLFLHRFLHGVFELSYQGRRPNGLDPETQSHLIPGVFKASVMPTLSWDRGTYSRPQLRLVYTISYLDEGARRSFPLEDPRRGVAVHHFLGAQVEWWYQSSYR
jgi:maltoporin